MDLAAWGLDRLDWQFFFSFLNIIFINIVLSGDNALIIAMAVRSLPRRQRRQGLVLGSGAAVIVQIIITFSPPDSSTFLTLNLSAVFSSSGSPSNYSWRGPLNRLTLVSLRPCGKPSGLFWWLTSPRVPTMFWLWPAPRMATFFSSSLAWASPFPLLSSAPTFFPC